MVYYFLITKGTFYNAKKLTKVLTVNFLAAELVSEPTEEELASEGTAEGDAINGGSNIGRECSGFLGAINVVVYAAKELGDKRNAEEIVSICKKTHTRDYNRCEMVHLRFGRVQSVQYFFPFPRHFFSVLFFFGCSVVPLPERKSGRNNS